MRSALLALAALALIGGGAATAEAGHGIVGSVYGRVGHSGHYSYNRGFYGGGRGVQFSYYRASPYRAYYGGGGHGHHGHHGHGGRHSWHDTSHYDYYPGGYVRHYDHYDYVPPHYDWHQEGHWDHH